MQITPQGVLILDTNNTYPYESLAQVHRYHHGHAIQANDHHRGVSPLLTIPSESLTHVTSFLDSASLFALGKTSKPLYEHVNDDNTWHRAFSCQFLSDGSDSNTTEASGLSKPILLRRTEESWKKEFVLRCNLLRRWERSRNGTVTHTPHYSPVDSMHLLVERSHGPALLSASLQYGVVARSLPLTGKVLKGFLSPADGIGAGIGNPNAEFMPNASACAIASEGWNARVVWGFGNGEVCLASATRVMETGRTNSKVSRCRVGEQHRGRVVSALWDDANFITAGADGEVKVWDAKHVRCVWVLKDQDSLLADACVHIVSDLARGIVLATKESGYTVVWSGISKSEVSTDRSVESEANVASAVLKIPPPRSNADAKGREPINVFLDPDTPDKCVSFGILFAGDPYFYRINADLSSISYETVRFANGPLGSLRVLHPFFISSEKGAQGIEGGTVILAGDSIGRVSFFDWSVTPEDSRNAVSSFRRLDAHPNVEGGVTALACTAHVLATGSARGTTLIYDILTLRLLHEFPSPAPRAHLRQDPETDTGRPRDANAVRNIILDTDMVLVSVGERVLAWKAGPVKPQKWKPTIKVSNAKGRNAKWHKRLEIAQDINESCQAAAESHVYAQQSHERRRAQLATLDSLGLDEHEALEYVLMLSRDEEETRRELASEGVFEADFDDIPSSATEYSTPFPSPPASTSLQLNPSAPRMRPSPTPSNVKVQVSPPLRPEPMEAGFSTSPLGINANAQMHVPAVLGDPEHFPAMSTSLSSSGSPQISPSVSGSWSARTKVVPPKPGGGTVSDSRQESGQVQRSTSNSSSLTPGPSLLSKSLRMHGQSVVATASSGSIVCAPEDSSKSEGMDADLKLAIELSLAEALSLQHI
ncbi:hypothetical protein EW145_g5671 [Phellinidium pouzarii]|uniref:F-box domain-containing protein n=1 Tax=Phellinidium pouzarii TaxID=167371 RepID=A0A4S4L3Z0_9AGAM|nr:hypothetical protein EW145_g5671 [Phellinidium pouzarii]